MRPRPVELSRPPEIWHEMILALRKELDEAGFRSVKIHMPDSPTLKGGTRAAAAIRQSPEAWQTVDFAATHLYDFQQFFEQPDGYDDRIREWGEQVGGKPFLSTEFTVNQPAYQSRSYRTAFAQAQLYHKNLALMDAEALLYCWTLLDIEQPSFGASRSLFVPDRSHDYVPVPSSYQLRTFGAFSRRLREGMVRVEAESGNPDLLVTAYEGEAGARAAILVNRATAPHRVRIQWPGARFTFVEIASPYLENAVLETALESLVIQPGEIMTLSTVPRRESPNCEPRNGNRAR